MRSSDKEPQGSRPGSGKCARAVGGKPGGGGEAGARPAGRGAEEGGGVWTVQPRAPRQPQTEPRRSRSNRRRAGLAGRRRRWGGELEEELLGAGRRLQGRRAPPPPALGRRSPPPATAAPTLRRTPRAAARAPCRAPAAPSCLQT